MAPSATLPVRNGVGPSCVALPAGTWPRVIDFLTERFAHVSPTQWAERMAGGDVVDERGMPVAPEQPYRAYQKLFYYRSLPPEAPQAEEETVLFEDDWLVVADKPHFLSVTPSGRYLQETLLVRLRRKLGLDDLAPLHRIDRETAGVVLFAKQAGSRGRYQTLFANREVSKTYQAIAPWNAHVQFPLVRESTIVPGDSFMRMCEQPATATTPRAPNAFTRIEVIEVQAAQGSRAAQGALARYRLHPLSGKRHQLRVHMAALGLPIVGDRIYPALRPEASDDPQNPLRLLAETIGFRDPMTGMDRHFATRRTLHF
jgi:tRNA pseudouridine32 synthase / 23S rRNA pseudouridine746 synthase